MASYKLRNWAFVLLLALPLSALDNSSPLTRYGRRAWQTESGLPQNTVHAILQTHDGFLWLATEGGLARFDGLQFLTYDSQNTPALKSNNIRALLEDRQQALWIGTANGLTRWSGGHFETFTARDGLPSDSVWSICQDRAGKVWIVTADGLAAYEAGRFKAYRFPESAANSIGAIVADPAGTLWLGTQDGVRLFDGAGKFIVPSAGAPLPAGDVQALLADAQGRIWIGTPNGLALYQNGGVTNYGRKEGLPGERIAALYQDRHGSVWVSTDGGLARISIAGVERFPPNDPLAAALVLSMYEDREGSLWLGTDSDGLTALRDEKFTTYTTREGLPSDLTRCVYQDGQGVVWIGTEGGLGKFDKGTFSRLTTRDGLSSNLIFALSETAQGDLLAGTPDGLNVLHDGHVSVLTSADGLADDFVRSLYRDLDGSTWIGTRRGLSHWANGRFTTYTQANGLGSDLIGDLLRDSQGDLWVATLRGLSRVSRQGIKTYTTRDGLSSDVITALLEDAAGALWIGTQDGGLNRFAAGKIFRYPPPLGLPSVVFGLLRDAARNLWITSSSGIYRVGLRELNAIAQGAAATLAIAQYGVADGLLVNESSEGGHPAAWKARDGSLWFTTLRGAAEIDRERSQANALPVPVVLEAVSVDDQAFTPAQPLDLAPGHERFSFAYAGLSFIAPQRVRFRYKLENFDKDWVDAGARRVAYYTNIPAGKYQFKVMARNSDGVWNAAGASFDFRLRPHFYQTYWFYFLLLAAAGLLGYGIYRYRVKQVEARFQAVLAERNRIAREIHDTLAQGFVAVSLQLELIGMKLTGAPEAAKDLLAQTREMVLNSLAEARRSIWELRSQSPGPEDLASRLSKMASEVAARGPVKVNFQVLGTYRALPGDVENELLRIGQEAVTNVVRHAEARHVTIDLAFDTKKIKMTIADDGKGFAGQVNAAGPDGHFGLRGMRERAARIGANLTVTSEPGKGTEISVEKVMQ